MTGGFDPGRLNRLEAVMAGYAERLEVPGLGWLVARRGEVKTGVAGSLAVGGTTPVARDSIFRISSMTKPVTAVAALILVEECVLRLDDPVDRFLPELADRRVVATPGGPLDDTVPAARPITLRDLLTFRMGIGYDFSAMHAQPVLAAMAQLDLGVGPPAPGGVPEPDEWIRRFGTLPLMHQPGERWLYNTSSDVLGVLVARASGQALEQFLRERIFDPLGMRDTGFFVAAGAQARFTHAYSTNPSTSARELYDAPHGQWSRRPAFPSGAGGLVSTLDDYRAFAEMLRAGGALNGRRILSRPSLETMTSDQLTPEQRAVSGVDAVGAAGWGFGVAVQVRSTGPTAPVGRYGWEGGLGSSWANDPREDLVGIVLTNQARTTSSPPPIADDFWTCAYAAIED